MNARTIFRIRKSLKRKKVLNEMVQIQYKDLSKIREQNSDKKIIFCSGSFDLPHAGHILFFDDCKRLGNILVVGVGGDEVIQQNKGPERPILNQHVRMKTIDTFKPIDYTILDDNKYNTKEQHKLGFVEYILKNLKPDVYVINEDAFDLSTRIKLTNQLGISLKVLKRSSPPEFSEISTSKIIKKIKLLSSSSE